MKKFSLLVVCVFSCSSVSQSSTADDQRPKHLIVAQTLVTHLEVMNTSYEHGMPDVHFSEPYRSNTDCSGFINETLRHTYGYTPDQFKEWFGRERPTADRYHDAIAKQEIFTQINDFRQIRAGDILAIKYDHPKEKSTGHVMLVAGPPRLMKGRDPVVLETDQWEVPVIDSARSGHGKTDTRHGKGKDGKDHDGLGEGILRVYNDRQGAIVGYTWSIAGKNFISQKEENMIVGRLKH